MEASLEILTDGSELTEPTIFLTIRRLRPGCNTKQYRHSRGAVVRTISGSNGQNRGRADIKLQQRHQVNDVDVPIASQQNPCDGSIKQHVTCTTSATAFGYVEDEDDGGTVLARYNLSGIPTLTSRLVSDQSFKLLKGGAFRSILVPSLTSYPMGSDDVADNNGSVDASIPGDIKSVAYSDTYPIKGACIAGLPSLFLSLLQTGYKVANELPPSSIDDGDDNYCELSSDEINGVEHNRNDDIIGGYGDVSIIGPVGIGALVDSILDTMFGDYRKRPSLRICEVPSSDSSSPCNWWEVYNDSYVKIWAQSVVSRRCQGGPSITCCEICESSRCADMYSQPKEHREVPLDGSMVDGKDQHDSIVYIVMLLPQLNAEKVKKLCKATTAVKDNNVVGIPLTNRPYSFAILPHGSMRQSSWKCHKCNIRPHRNTDSLWNALRQLPHDIVSSTTQKDYPLLDCILHFDPPTATNGSDEGDSHLQPPSSKRQRAEDVHEESLHKTNFVPRLEINVPSWATTSNLTSHHLITVPNRNAIDAGILIRAQHRSRLLNKSLSFAFPLNNKTTAEGCTNMQPRQSDVDSTWEVSRAMAYRLQSCTSVILHGWIGVCDNELSRYGDDDDITILHPFTFIARIDSILNRCMGHTFSSWTELDNKNETLSNKMNYAITVQALRCKFSSGDCICGECEYASATTDASNNIDDNEIDLNSGSDCENEHDNDCEGIQHHVGNDGVNGKCASNVQRDCVSEGLGLDVSTAHLLMLGTGCATPSPLRGSSAYGLLVPTSIKNKGILVLSALIECGEGTLTGLFRHLPSLEIGDVYVSRLSTLQFQLSYVGFIWISHAHLDHYGDLPLLVQSIANAKKKCTTRPQSRIPLFVIAPTKVLKYLELFCDQLNAPNELRMFVGVTHQEYQLSRSPLMLKSYIDSYALFAPPRCNIDTYCPFHSIINVGVEHCRDAYALMIRLRFPSDDKFDLCFSGDTRPSPQLIRKCSSYFGTGPDLLIHEGTFLDDAQGNADAVMKRHSTTVEALNVANAMSAKSCILTHFSQRYKHVSTTDACSTSQLSCFHLRWGIALDGMMIPLRKNALSEMFQLSQCVDAVIISKSSDDS